MIGSLFSGIGGLELGLEWAGLGPTAFQVEIDPFCRKVLSKHWPEASRFEDVKAVGIHNLPKVDILCGGFPCQDVSSAGAGAGLKHGTRSGLWYEYLRIVGELRPARVIVENVASGAKRWLCEVRGNLHAVGYRTRAFALSAADVGAPHLRKRIFIVASNACPSWQPAFAEHAEVANTSAVADVDFGELRIQSRRRSRPEGNEKVFAPEPSQKRNASHANSKGRQGAWADTHEGWKGSAEAAWRSPISRLVPVVHGISGGLDGRNRRAKIRALGNAVVPQCAEVIGRMIVEGYI